MPTLKLPTSQFPLSVAKGDAFCNRKQELERLHLWIAQRKPVLLYSPRRYGKTSLALRAIEKTKLPYAHIDLFSVIDELDIERLILKGVAQLISQVGTTAQKALNIANKIFEGTQVKVALSKYGIEVSIEKNRQKPAYRILSVLERIELLAKQAKTPLIIFFDEFQCIGQVTTNHAIEAVLRQVAQLTDTISFIFSGNNRHLLEQLFEDRNKPFYKLCEKITLERITLSAYTKHLESISVKQWGKQLSASTIDIVCSCTQRHPYYMNVLCSRLLLLGSIPNPEEVETIWDQYTIEERSTVASEVDLLSKNQKKLLTVLARVGGTKAPLGKDFIYEANMSKTTIEQALGFLEKRDYVYKDELGNTKILDPLINDVLSVL